MTRRSILTALLTTTAALGYDGNGVGWKMDGDKIAVDDAGNPVFVAADGREMSVKGDTIGTLQNEAKTNRLRAEKAEGVAAKYKDIPDPAAALAALDTVSKLDAKKLIDAGKVDEVRAEITRQFEGKIAEADKAVSTANQQISDMRINSAFASSEFMRDRVAVPPEMFQATFRDRFKDENGKVVAYGADGNPVYSKKHVGEIADFDEALTIMVDNYKHKDQILKAPEQGGSGSGGGGGARGQGRSMSRADFEALPPPQQAEFAGKMGTGEATLTD